MPEDKYRLESVIFQIKARKYELYEEYCERQLEHFVDFNTYLTWDAELHRLVRWGDKVAVTIVDRLRKKGVQQALKKINKESIVK